VKEKLSEYYKLSEPELKKHWQQDIFSFDANVLLNLYRYSPSTRDAFFQVLEKISDRIWITYQAAYEYQKNRLNVINAQKEAYQEIKKVLLKKRGEIESLLNEYKRHPYLKIEELIKRIEKAFDSINQELEKLEKAHPDYLNNDPIWDRLTKILAGKIGDDYQESELNEVYKEGKKRYEQEIPPGYKDLSSKKNQGERSLYGDLIVWKQIIDKAKSQEKSMILVTDDLKEDWWYKFNGKTIGPRVELIKEYKEKTQKRINIYKADIFLELINTNLEQLTASEAIKEVRDVRMRDELAIDAQLKKAVSELKSILEENGEENEFEKAVKIAIAERENNLKK
jgi:hypothetical protein